MRDSAFDGILVWDGSRNVVIDHCSVTNASDENINITEDTANVTVSWCLIGDTRSNSFALHTSGMLITNFNKGPVTNVSLHHNLFVNEYQRSPQVSTAGLFDLRNNVIWDWGSYGIRMRNGAWGNIVNNVFDTNNNPGSAVILANAGPVHIQGNQGPGSRNVHTQSTSTTPYAVALVTTDPVAQVEQKVLQRAGACPRDAIDSTLAGATTACTQPPDTSNQPPVAQAGADRTATVGEPLSFDGSSSTDPDGDLLTYVWDFGDGTSNAPGVTATHSYTTPGTYPVTLTVDDGEFLDSDTATVVVTTPSDQPQALFLGADTTTQGNWPGIYGTAGYLLLNRGGGQDVVSLPPYLSAYTYSSTTQFFVWSSNTTDTRALAPISGSRAAATAYSGNTFSLTLTARDTTSHTLTLYFVDWDNRGRRQTVTFYDATTNAILDQRTLSSFRNGVYYTYQVQGSVRVEMRRLAGDNATLSGMFWD